MECDVKRVVYNPHYRVKSNEMYIAARNVCQKLQDAGHLAYFVGGAVRDLVLRVDVAPKEIDIASSAMPGEVQQLFRNTEFVGKAFGVCLVRVENAGNALSHQFEVATFRKEGNYSDRRHPDSVEKGNMEEDSCRRDFTMNALYFDPVSEAIFDFHDGISHALKHQIYAVGKPAERFQEDALRIIRLFRFAANCFMDVNSETLNGAIEAADGLRFLSKERIIQECLKVNSGCFLDFSVSFFSAIIPSELDQNLPSSFDSSVGAGMWQESIHSRYPLTAMALVLAGSGAEAYARFQVCARAFEKWPCTRSDERLMRVILRFRKLALIVERATIEIGLLRIYQFIKDFQHVSLLDALFIMRAAFDMLPEKCSLVEKVLLRMNSYTDSTESVQLWLSSKVADRVTGEQRKNISQIVHEKGLKPQLIGVWVDLCEASAFFQSIGILVPASIADKIEFEFAEELFLEFESRLI